MNEINSPTRVGHSWFDGDAWGASQVPGVPLSPFLHLWFFLSSHFHFPLLFLHPASQDLCPFLSWNLHFPLPSLHQPPGKICTTQPKEGKTILNVSEFATQSSSNQFQSPSSSFFLSHLLALFFSSLATLLFPGDPAGERCRTFMKNKHVGKD